MAESVTSLRLKVDSTDVKNAEKDLNKLGSESKKLEAGIASLSAKLISGALAFGSISAAASSFISTAGKFEQYAVSLKVLSGSAAAAEKSFAWVKDFTAKTPYTLDETMEAFIRLKAYGIDATNGSLKTLGDTAAAMGKPLMAAVEAMADAMVGENERLKEFGIRASKDGDTIAYKWMDSSGKAKTQIIQNNGEIIKSTLEAIFNDKYAGMMDEQSKTWVGAVSNLEDTWTSFKDSLARDSGIFEAAKETVKGLNEALNGQNETLNTLLPIITSLGVTYGVMKTASIGAALAETALDAIRRKSIVTTTAYNAALMRNVTTTTTLTAAQTASALATSAMGTALKAIPFLAVAGVVSTLAMSFFDAKKNSDELRNSLDQTAETLAKLTKNQLEFREATISLNIMEKGLELRQAKQKAQVQGIFQSDLEYKEELANLDMLKQEYKALMIAGQQVRDFKSGKLKPIEETKTKSEVTTTATELTKAQIAAGKKAKAEAEKLAKEEAEQERKIDHELNQSKLNNIQKITLARQEAETDVENATIQADTDNQIRKQLIIDGWKSELEKLNDSVVNEYDFVSQMFPDGIPNEWFDNVNNRFKDLKENVSNMDFSASIEFDPQGLDGTAKAIAGIGKSTSALSKAEAQYQKNKAKTGATAEDLAENEAQYTQDQLAGYSNMAGAMSAMFEEGSKESEAFQAVQSGLAVISAVAAVMNAGTSGDGYTAVARMLAVAATATSFLSQIGKSLNGGGTSQSDIAAYTAGNTGTGTILGDATAQSESIAKSLDMLSDIAKPEFKLISEMNASLKSIDIKLGGTAANIVQRGGFATGVGAINSSTLSSQMVAQNRFFGQANESKTSALNSIFGSYGENANMGLSLMKAASGITFAEGVANYLTEGLFGGGTTTSTIGAGISFGPQNLQSAIDNLIGKSFQTVLTETDGGWFGGDESSIYDTFSTLDSYTKTQFQLVLKDLYDVTDTAGEILGESVEGSLNSVIINLGKISLMGKSGEQIQKALESVFSSVGDKIASQSLPLVKPFQAIGEGMFETMVRVSSGMEEAKYYTEKLGTEVIKYTEILDKSGDVGSEALRQSINIMDEAIYGIDNGVSLIIDSLSQGTDTIFETYKALSEMRFQITATNQDIRGLTSAMLYGAGGISELSDGLSTYIDSFLTEQEQLQYRTEVMSAEFAKLGLSLPKSSAEFRSLVEGIDLTTEAGQKLYGGIIVLSDGFSELSASSEGIKSSLFDNIRAFISELNNELKTNDPSVSFYNFTSSFNEMVDAISNGSDNLLEVGNTALDNAKSYLATVTATATAGRDIQFAKAMLVNKFSGVIAEPDVSLNTINNTLVSNNALLVQELQSLKFELTSIKNMTVDQRATTENSLTTLRGILGSVAV